MTLGPETDVSGPEGGETVHMRSKRPSCEQYEWMIGPLIDGELPAADAEEVQGHLGGCAACTRLAEDFRSFDRLAARMETPPSVSSEEWARVLAAVRREPLVSRFAPRRRLIDWLAPALSLAALVLAGAWVILGVADRPEPKRIDEAAVRVLFTIDKKPDIQETPDAIIIDDPLNL